MNLSRPGAVLLNPPAPTYHCSRCEVSWSDGPKCWACGLRGVIGPLSLMAVVPADVHITIHQRWQQIHMPLPHEPDDY